jgi:hypothetical protein
MAVTNGGSPDYNYSDDNYNKAEKSNPDKRSKEFTSPINEGAPSELGRTVAPKDPATPKGSFQYIDELSKADEDNHKNSV